MAADASGRVPDNVKRRAAWLLLLALLAGWALRLVLLDAFPLREDEALYGFWARSVWTDPRFLTIFPDKPPLFLWLQALALELFGVTSAAARMLNILASTATIALVAACARSIWRAHPVHGLFAALASAWLLSLNPFAISFAATAYTDSLLVFWGVASIALALRGRLLWAGVWLGAAIMTKQQGLLFAPVILTLALLYLTPGPSLSRGGRTGEGGSARFLIASYKRMGWLLAGCALVVVPVLLWDVSRWAVAPSPWALGVQNYAALGLATLGAIAQRAQAWRAVLWFGAGSVWAWLLLGMLALAGGILLWRGARNAATLVERWAPLVLLLWIAGFLAAHLFSTVQPWDRYLLPIFPVAAILLGGGAGALYARWGAGATRRARALMAGIVLLALLVFTPPALTAARGGFPIGADHGAYTGLDEAAQWLGAQEGRPLAVYHRVLGWNLDYALFDAVAGGRAELRWFPNAVYLADNASKSPWRRNMVVEPEWASTRDLAMQVAARGLVLHERLRAGGITVYEITARDTEFCAWCLCRAPVWSALPVDDPTAYQTRASNDTP